MRKLAKETNTIVLDEEGANGPHRAIIPISPDEIVQNLYKVRESAGVIFPEGKISEEAISLLSLYSAQTAAYAIAKADENIREKAVRLARLGVSGIIIEGSLSMLEKVPIDIAVSQAHDALRFEIDEQDGKILRNKVKIIARTAVRSSRDIYALCCLGADAIALSPKELISDPSYQRQLNLIRGLKAELQLLMGASGLSMMSSIIGNREILRADHYMKEETAALLGVNYIGT